MLRTARLVMIVLIAIFIVAVPTAVAQSPSSDQYALPADSGAGPADDAAAAGGDIGVAPVEVRELTGNPVAGLPFTGGQISLIALMGLALIAAGAAGLGLSRRRTSAVTS